MIVTESGLLEELRVARRDRAICIDELARELAAHSTVNLNIKVEPKNLVYVMYTSGLTGTPKGVMVQNDGVGGLHIIPILGPSMELTQ